MGTQQYGEDLPKAIEEMQSVLKSLKAKKKRREGLKIDKQLPAVYNKFLKQAFKRNIQVTLTVDEFLKLKEKSCIYCGNEDKIGIDRKDYALGYTYLNCQPCCSICNLMKYTHSETFFLNHIERIFNTKNL